MRTGVYWIEGPWRGRLAIMPRPRGGDWLEVEIEGWHSLRIDTVVSALTNEENDELGLEKERELAESKGIDYVRFSIADRSVPTSRKEMLELVRLLERKLNDGGNVAIHCRQGIGRAAILAAGVLIAGGVEQSLAWERIAAARGTAVPDTREQRDWVTRFANDIALRLRMSSGSELEERTDCLKAMGD